MAKHSTLVRMRAPVIALVVLAVDLALGAALGRVKYFDRGLTLEQLGVVEDDLEVVGVSDGDETELTPLSGTLDGIKIRGETRDGVPGNISGEEKGVSHCKISVLFSPAGFRAATSGNIPTMLETIASG